MPKRFVVVALAVVVVLLGTRASAAGSELYDAAALPLAVKRLPASTEECAVWRRERSFAHSVEAHDENAWASHLHPGVIFGAGTADADRGRDQVLKLWPDLSGRKNFVLRWRPGIVMIGGEPRIAVSLGPYVFQDRRKGVDRFEVGLYQTVWVREENDGIWRVLFDGDASTSMQVADRAAADAWVAAQAMSDCDEASARP
jgi:hypothetical protein